MAEKNKLFSVFFCTFFMTLLSIKSAFPLVGLERGNVQGGIVDSACAISVGNLNQAIEMERIHHTDIIRDGYGRSQTVFIDLVNCVLHQSDRDGWKKFSITIDGKAEGQNFKVSGNSSGVSLQITDLAGNIVLPGIISPLSTTSYRDMRLGYIVKLVGNSQAVEPGDFFSSIRFKMSYF